jgi:hypothetical protein
VHQCFDERALFSFILEFHDLLWRAFFLRTEMYAPFFRFLNAIHLSLGAYLSFKLADGTEHVEQQTTCRIAGVDVLIEHLAWKICRSAQACPTGRRGFGLLNSPTHIQQEPCLFSHVSKSPTPYENGIMKHKMEHVNGNVPRGVRYLVASWSAPRAKER